MRLSRHLTLLLLREEHIWRCGNDFVINHSWLHRSHLHIIFPLFSLYILGCRLIMLESKRSSFEDSLLNPPRTLLIWKCRNFMQSWDFEIRHHSQSKLALCSLHQFWLPVVSLLTVTITVIHAWHFRPSWVLLRFRLQRRSMIFIIRERFSVSNGTRNV